VPGEEGSPAMALSYTKISAENCSVIWETSPTAISGS